MKIIAVFLLFYVPAAFAYLDPGTGSILLQALFAGIAGLCAILKIYWNRITGWFKQKPEKNENKQHKN